MMLLFAIATGVFVLAMLLAERARSRIGVAIAKPLASFGFIGAALAAGIDSPYRRAVLVALAFGWLGDVLLIGKSKRMFLAGLAVFLLGHAAFAVAFVLRGIDPTASALALVVLLLPGAIVWRWLSPHVGSMRVPVAAYVVVISVMVALALGTARSRESLLIPLGALMFYVSDISVARDQFVARGLVNRLWGLPSYYAAQLILAASS